MSLYKPYFRVRAEDDMFKVEHNCNGSLNFMATDIVDPETARLINFAMQEGARRKGGEIMDALGSGLK